LCEYYLSEGSDIQKVKIESSTDFSGNLPEFEVSFSQASSKEAWLRDKAYGKGPELVDPVAGS
jgi:hypothetical protein